MTFEAKYFRAHIEQEVPNLTTDEERLTAENLYDLLDPETVDEGVSIELGDSIESLQLLNRLLGVEAGIKGGTLRFNQVITSLDADHNYGLAHRGKIIPLLIQSSIIDSLTYAQATTWGHWRERSSGREHSIFSSRLLIAEPLDRTPEGLHDIEKPWVGIEGEYAYDATQRRALGNLARTLVPDDENWGRPDIETGIYRDHPAFTAYALARLVKETGIRVPAIPTPSLSIQIGHPEITFWGGANHIVTRRSYRPRNGKFIQSKHRADEAA